MSRENDPLCLDSNTVHYGEMNDIEILLKQHPTWHYCKMKLVWYEDPQNRPLVKATCDRWFGAPDQERLDHAVMNWIKKNGIKEAHLYKPRENQDESNSQVSKTGKSRKQRSTKKNSTKHGVSEHNT